VGFNLSRYEIEMNESVSVIEDALVPGGEVFSGDFLIVDPRIIS
jgi:hypothetical protein